MSKTVTILPILMMVLSCNLKTEKQKDVVENYMVHIAGAMKNVMWKGKLAGIIDLDTIQKNPNLYGLGPVEYLKGELLIVDGETYRSTVLSDTSMQVEKTDQAKAPFFVYGTVKKWRTQRLPGNISNLKQLEYYITEQTLDLAKPFIFRIKGQVSKAKIHIQNLPDNSVVRSPQEAHVGQQNYMVAHEEVDIIGFYSNRHQGIFTHHDTHMHMHLITADKSKMGHLDDIEFGADTIELLFPAP
ncbi:MAG: acetolactate decarboxylase [Saonia sp.]